MLTNSSLTVYHKKYDDEQRLETWERFNYDKVWWFGGKSANVEIGYENTNDVQIRVPFGFNSNLNIGNFSIGDIVVKGTLNIDIETQQDLSNYDVYNITSIRNNDFGRNKHIHIGGK